MQSIFVNDTEEEARIRREHPLATLDGLEAFVGALAYMGALCPACGFGTRVTSRRWAKCKKCGTRVERRKLPDPPQREGGGSISSKSEI